MMFGLDYEKMCGVIRNLLHVIVVILVLAIIEIGISNETIFYLCFGLLLVMITYLLLQILQRMEK